MGLFVAQAFFPGSDSEVLKNYMQKMGQKDWADGGIEDLWASARKSL
jgi:hypothetical protein